MEKCAYLEFQPFSFYGPSIFGTTSIVKWVGLLIGRFMKNFYVILHWVTSVTVLGVRCTLIRTTSSTG